MDLHSLKYTYIHAYIGDLEQDVAHLKAKVEAGADLVVTQLFYSTDLFVDYVRRCRQAGITVCMYACVCVCILLCI